MIETPPLEPGQVDSLGITHTGAATGLVELGDALTPIQVIGTPAIRESMGASCIAQAITARRAPGVSQLVLNPDAHYGYGVPVGSVLISPSHIYPGPVGVDIKCSMSLLQTDVPAEAIADLNVRRQLIREIESRLGGTRRGPRNRGVNEQTGFDAAVNGAHKRVLQDLDVPKHWTQRCEDAWHTDSDGGHDRLALRLEKLIRGGVIKDLLTKSRQLGSYGGGNHFGECEVVRVQDSARARQVAEAFGLKDGCVAFLSHCGSRGLGHALATNQFRTLLQSFRKRKREIPGGDPELVYVEYGSPEADQYLNDMALGANFATVNHLVINAIVAESFRKILPGCQADLVYYISHNMAKQEIVDGQHQWVHRKGATRALPAGHAELEDTPFASIGHPILLPGNPRDGSSIMVADPGAVLTAFSVNHGAGRRMTRTAAKAQLRASEVEKSLSDADVISNRRHYPIDEAPDAYKDFAEVLRSVQLAGLATEVAKLEAKFVIKDAE